MTNPIAAPRVSGIATPAASSGAAVPAAAAWRVERGAGHPLLGALSPSRASDFTTCPLLYRYRAIDRLPEPPGEAAARGTLVHTVLEGLFDLPAPERVLERAIELLPASWDAIVADEPDLVAVIPTSGDTSPAGVPLSGGDTSPAGVPLGGGGPSPAEVASWLSSAEPLLATYFQMEDPRRLEPAHRELHVEYQLPDGPLLRGYVDRVDIAEGVGVRIVDYKTGRSPGPRFEQKALFQLRFYALVVWRMTGALPRLLQLTYLGNGEFLRFEPDAEDLVAFEAKVRSLWRTIVSVAEAGDFQPRPGPLCRWCSFHALCPAQGGEMLPLPAVSAVGASNASGADLEPVG